MPDLTGVIYISEWGMPVSRSERLTEARNNINELFGHKYPYSFGPDDVKYFEDQPEQTCVINYTSGSTGMSKGVMLPCRSLWSNIKYCLENLTFFNAGDNIVNMLPLAHMYGMVIEMLNPFCTGCHCYFLTKLPSPKVILKAFADVKPRLIITVPLIVEKIIRNKVFPMLDKPLMKILLRVPYLDDRLLAKIKENLLQAFGGNLAEIIIGGAPLNPDVEKFLYKIGFPVTVGRVVDNMEVKIDSPDPEHVPGNIMVRGTNVMNGYYKNQKATDEVLAGFDGWMNTGDMGTIDAEGFITINGRSKTMILGPSGQNIYPEEIEAKLNNLPYVNESLVIEDGDHLEALVHPDFDAALTQHIDRDELEKIMLQNLDQLNTELPSYSKVKSIKIMEEEFEKTPKRSIKRFLYQH